MNRNQTSKKIKNIALTGIGIALFVVLSLCLQVPVFENYYLCLGYIVMAVYAYSIGTGAATIVGTIGVVLYCLLINGLRGMPGWALGNLAMGLIIGPSFQMIKNTMGKDKKNSVLQYTALIATIMVANVIGIIGIKSITESILYAQPFWFRATKNLNAFVADICMLVVSVPLCKFLDSHLQKIIKQS